ncbi:PhoH family protein [Halocella sp. SP3-1]|uniref:PhoH family protein n=1 Tax=Halocella sp. SP3-1 TaxID=2382161 RepID=UPI000F760A95|nr:PhoH family protein [Halocella sp. SP3-1]AZO95013.1 PhoH family protein [Halocella sp. SP3-1]MTI61287.1 PhoH family protein [Bacillota bacterium]
MSKTEKTIVFDDYQVLQNLFGNNDNNLKIIEKKNGIKIIARGNSIKISGEQSEVEQTENIIKKLSEITRNKTITEREVKYAVELLKRDEGIDLTDLYSDVLQVSYRGKKISIKTLGQKLYIEAIKKSDIVFAIGPAGTGKTYLAMVMAVKYLLNKVVNRIILTRPAIEAGEKLGFLPGDMQDKVDPYLRPLYDALYDILGPEKVAQYLEKDIIEVAPLAYMRGRTLDDSFVILDEAQNTTPEQMKMFLTRIGFNSQAVITGDITQVDLPGNKNSGLNQVREILQGIKGIDFVYLSKEDVVRHELVKKIIQAYERHEDRS